MGPINIDNDRRTRMIDSSVKASMKKGGGGGYNWGSTMDITDYEPMSEQSEPLVSVGPPLASPTKWSRRGYKTNLDKNFPELSTTTEERPAIAWGPGMNPKPAAALEQTRTDSCRRSTVSFDAQHPRNQFSTSPRKARSCSRSRTSTMSTEADEPTEESQEKEHQVTPLHILKSQPDHKKPVQIKPKLQKNTMSRKPSFAKRPCVTQARAR